MPRKITRRSLGLAALATKAAAAQSSQAANYQGALDGFESEVSPAAFDSLAWSRERWKSAPLKLTFRATSAKDAAAWQKKLRPKIEELIGGFPPVRVPLAPKTLEVKDYPNYRREKVVFASRDGMSVLAYLLTPKKAQGPLPAVVCVPGHGRGVDDIVGVDSEGRDRTNKAGYQHDFAIQVVEQGLAAVAIEPLGFGCRRDPASKARGLGNSSCQPAAGAALLFGETMIAWRVWDVMRTIDWIETRSELDSKRVACMGISGGGTCTVFATALEPRVKAAMVSGYLNTFRDSILSISHCMDNYVPGILNWAEMYDIAGLIAPRPLFIESGARDNIFPVEASRESFAKVREIYRVFGAESKTAQEVFDAEHIFHGAQGLPFLKRHLTA